METVDDDGYTVAVDIDLLGAVIYEVVTGSRCESEGTGKSLSKSIAVG